MKKINMDEFTEKYHDYLNRYANVSTNSNEMSDSIKIFIEKNHIKVRANLLV